MISEFEIIEKYFKRKIEGLGIGDDAAAVVVPAGKTLLTTVDTMVEDVHFLKEDDPYSLGYKLMAVNLSDIAAMGGKPRWATLALTLPCVDETWLQGFSEGLFAQAEHHNVALIGGDTTQGKQLVFSLQMMGVVDQAISRSGAKPGEDVYVSGYLGAAAFALAHKLEPDSALDKSILRPLHFPQAQVALGKMLQGLASAMIDVSDGLLQDLSHILNASKVGAKLEVEALPIAKVCEALSEQQKYSYALTGGEDYGLCFTAAKTKREKVLALAEKAQVSIHRIGVLTEKSGLEVEGLPVSLNKKGYSHF